jgi:dethiobiotin synthetase
MGQHYFIAATGTGIGKTFITAALVRQAKALGHSVAAFKPLISGFDASDPSPSDTALLAQSMQISLTPDAIDEISPWRFKAPLAPSMAARLEGRPIDFLRLVEHSQTVLKGPLDHVLIEGVGGVMVPVDDGRTVLDWIEPLGVDVILVAGSYLGTISHTLTALAVLRNRNIRIAAVVVNQSETETVAFRDTVSEMKSWIREPVIAVTRRTGDDGWINVAELRELLIQT